MFKKKIYELFSGMQDVLGIAYYILIAGFGDLGKDHDVTLNKVLRICKQTNLNVNKHKCLFRCTSISFFSKIIYCQDVSLDPRKVQALTDMPPPKSKRELQSFFEYTQLPKYILISNC